jgi:hypothetical protein
MTLAATSAAASLTSSLTSVVISLAFSIYSSSFSRLGNRLVDGLLVLCVHKEGYDAPSEAAHCQNYLFVCKGVPNLAEGGTY